jgi:peptidoglycan/xylan/chitin deacetylase (PgdA/CDA1 family)
MYFTRTPSLLMMLSGHLVWKIRTSEKKIYLTFDDGPNKETTGNILDLLHRHGAGATFFLTGRKAGRHPGLVDEIRRRGHTLGNHTFDHLNGWKTSTGAYLDNILKCDEVTASDLFRPPYGRLTPAQVKRIRDRYAIVLWTVMPGDFDARRSPEEVARNLYRYAEPGSIIVLHDMERAWEKVSHVLPGFLDDFSRRGYTFEPLTREACIRKGHNQ